MKKVLIIQPTELVLEKELYNISDYIQKGINKGVIILNKNITYEFVEIDDTVITTTK